MTDQRAMVCFASSFRYETAPNISHATLDGERTLCGRTGWETTDPWHEHGPDCLRCARALKRRQAKLAAEHDQQGTDQ